MAYQQQKSPSLGDLVGTGQGVDAGSIFETLGGMASGIGSAVGSAAGAAAGGIGSILDGGLGIDPMSVGTGMPFLADGPIGQGISALGELFSGDSWMTGFGDGSSGGGGAGSSW